MFEVLAAVAGASISVAAMTFTGMARRNGEGRDAILRLSMGVESIASRLEDLHIDFKSDRKEIFSRLNSMEQRIAKLEVKP